MSLSYAGQQLTIYVGFFLVVVGVVGNGTNILVFSSVRNYRKTPCTFYFLIGSIYNIAYLFINLISRIVMSGFGVDLTRTSVSWCKMRQFFLATLCLISLSCSGLATIDQFFATSKNASLRRLSNIKWSHRIVWIMKLVWCLHGIPFLLFFDISPVKQICMSTSTAFAVYFPSIYILTINCAMPVVVMVLFDYLTYSNIQQTRILAEQNADRQLTRMILTIVLLVTVSYVPYGIYNIYILVTAGINKDPYRVLQENLAGTVANLVCYFYFSVDSFWFLKLYNEELFVQILFREAVICF